jgi:eukaryotic-like serine/threonine-protein kinase
MATSESPAEAIFFAALEKGSPEERVRYLAEACGGDTELRSRVEHLLNAHPRVGVLDAPAVTNELPLDPPILLTPPGTVIGRYKLLEPIGEGGYGVVFMAEQTSPVVRKVALKIIKAGMDTRQVIARFEAERQALALMDHPNIAKVFDAGTTDTGRPYFVMELVKGMPITKYCDAQRIEPRQRLELFMQVCQAVQHAHQKGIIHRDLKPSNVLVAQYDGKPVPKVIDFGVAKATGQQLTDLTMFTGFGDVIGTLEYMSPEQAEVNQLDVDTRSDIYSLGVLLYELLTGSTPLEHKRVMKAGLLEMLRVVREEEAPKPSMRLSTTEQLPSISANRGVEPKKLSGLVKGELDWIVMKALEKDRGRRYETANGLAMDVQRYLSDDAVLACPPSARYRLRKFARRHKAALTMTTVMAAVLVLATFISTWQALRARKAERLAETRLIAEAQARKQAQANLGKAREAVQEITQIADEKLSNVPHLEGVRRELLESALQFYLGFLRQESNDRDIRRETAIAYGRAAEIHRYLGNRSKADELMRESITRLEKLAAESGNTPADRVHLVNCYNDLSFYGVLPHDEKVAKLRRAIQLAEQLVRQFPDERHYKYALAQSYTSLGQLLMPAQLEEAERLIRMSLRLAEESGDERLLAGAHFDMGCLMLNKANPEAEQWLRRALADWEKLGTQSSWHQEMAARTLSQLGYSLVSARKPPEAAEAFRRSVDIWLALIRDYPSIPGMRTECACNYVRLGISLAATGQAADADIAFEKALEVAPQDPSPHNSLAWYLATSADTKLRDPGRAVQLAKRAVELAPTESSYWNTLGTARYRAGDWRGAIEALKKSEELQPGRQKGFDAPFLAMAHWQLGEHDEARNWYGEAVKWMEENKEPLGPRSKAELHRFRNEAEELLKITDQKPTTNPEIEVK